MTKVSQWFTTMASETPGSTVSLVGQGSILDKSSLHTVGCLGKVSNVDPCAAPADGFCPVCKAKGQLQALRTYRFNFTQSIYLCANPQCIYPLGYTPLDNIIANTADLQKHHSPGKQKKRCLLDTSVTTNCVKKHKTDSFVSGEYISENLFLSAQNKGYKSMSPCLPKESHTSVPGPSENGQDERSQQQYGMCKVSACNSASPHGDRAPSVEFALRDSNQPNHPQEALNAFHEEAVQNQVMGMTIASINGPSPLKWNVPATKDMHTLSQSVNAANDPPTCINQKTDAGIAEVLNGFTKAEANMCHSVSVLSTCAPLGSPRLRLSALKEGHKQSDIRSASCSSACLEKVASETALAAMSDSNMKKEDSFNMAFELLPSSPPLHSFFGASQNVHTSEESSSLLGTVGQTKENTISVKSIGSSNVVLNEGKGETSQFTILSKSHSEVEDVQKVCVRLPSSPLLETALQMKAYAHSDKLSAFNNNPCLEKVLPEATPVVLSETYREVQDCFGSLPSSDLHENEPPLEERSLVDKSNSSRNYTCLEKVVPEATLLLKEYFSESCSKVQDDEKCFGSLPSSALQRKNPLIEKNGPSDKSSASSNNVCLEEGEPEAVPLLEDCKSQTLVVPSTCSQLSITDKIANSLGVHNSSDSCQLISEIHHDHPSDGNDLTVSHIAFNVGGADKINKVKSLQVTPLPEVISTELCRGKSNSQSTCEPPSVPVLSCKLSSEQKDEGTLMELSSSLHSETTEEEECGNKMALGSSTLDGEISDYKKLNSQIKPLPQAIESLVMDTCDSNLCNNINLKDSSKIISEEATVPHCFQPEQHVVYSHPMSDPAVTCVTHGTGSEMKALDTPRKESNPVCKELRERNVNPMKELYISLNNAPTDLSNSLCSDTTNVEESRDATANASSLSNGEILHLYHKTSSPALVDPKAEANTVLGLCDSVLSKNSTMGSSDSINQEKAIATTFAHPGQSVLFSHGASTITVSPGLFHSAVQALDVSDTPELGCSPVCKEPTVVQDKSDGSFDTSLGHFEREKQNESFETDSSVMLTDDHIKDPKDVDVVLSLPEGSLEDCCPKKKSNCSENMHVALKGTSTNPSLELGSHDAPCEKKLLQWRNTLFLCWLDCILAALVHSASLNSIVAQRRVAESSIIHLLLEKYKEANALIKSTSRRGRPKNLSQAENILNKVRMTIFDEIKPLLKCELGDKESPVFALPLLLQLVPEIESCFVHSGVWEFTCKLCGYQYQNKHQRTVSTFTKILPEWTPLNAIHKAPCNKCLGTDQIRAFRIKKIHDLFILHFVEGLPSNDLGMYSFHFEGCLYEVKTVIQYSEDHFSSWIANEDGTWLESDDLKGYFCIKQNCFEVPASEIHIVIWEKKITNSTGAHHAMEPETKNKALNSLSTSPSSLSQTLHLSPSAAPNAASSPLRDAPNASSVLSGMEGFHDDDIITLTLIEIPIDASGNVIENNSEAAQQPSLIAETHSSPVTLKAVADGQCDQNLCSGTMKESSFAGGSLPVPNISSPPAPNISSPPAPNISSPPAPHISSPPAPHISSPPAPHISSPPAPHISSPPAPHISSPPAPHISSPPAPNSASPPAPNSASTPLPNSSSSKKAFVGSWMKSLLNKNPLFLTSNVPCANKKTVAKTPIRFPLLKTTDLQASTKQAQSFDGFKAKRVGNSFSSDNCLGVGPTKDNSTAPKPAISSQTFQPLVSNRLKNGRLGLGNTKDLAKNVSLSKEDKVLRLRLKMLKKLKAKKHELAAIDMLGKSQAGSDLERSSTSRREQLRGFLQELQEQIDNADTESVCTMSSCTSICSSPGDAEFFAELFSPPPSNAPQESMDDSNFLEMYVDGYNPSCGSYGTSNPSGKEVSQDSANIGQSNLQRASDSHNNTNVGDVFHDMLSTSTMHMLNEDYFSPFDDMF
uniref:Ubiquitin specific peptidase like 1 n=2 Tax=Xenopus tropicalis TaxID=8364 RepID=A0A6I8T0F7_XENTR